MYARAGALSLVLFVVAANAAAQDVVVENTMAVEVARCATEVRRTLLVDETHATVRPLDEPDYRLRVDDRRIRVTRIASGWALRARVETTALPILVEIRETRTGALVLRQHVSLPCGDHGEDLLGEIAPPHAESVDDDLDAVPATDRSIAPPIERAEFLLNAAVDGLTDWGWLSADALGHTVYGHVPLDGAHGIVTNPVGLPELGVRVTLLPNAYVSALARPAMNKLGAGSYNAFSELSLGIGARSTGTVRGFVEADVVGRIFWSPVTIVLDAEIAAGVEVAVHPGVWLGAYVHKSVVDLESFGTVAYVGLSM